MLVSSETWKTSLEALHVLPVRQSKYPQWWNITSSPAQHCSALCSEKPLHQELSFASELHPEHGHCPLGMEKLQSSFTSQCLCLCGAQLEMETFNRISSCKGCLQTRQVTLQSLYTLPTCTTNFLQQPEVFAEEDTVAQYKNLTKNSLSGTF